MRVLSRLVRAPLRLMARMTSGEGLVSWQVRLYGWDEPQGLAIGMRAQGKVPRLSFLDLWGFAALLA